ncbi:hypothetical protein GKZ68_19790 [Hymenobacter sp. BRD128]|uniref:hypothetical protein n=1 Tax=Hymenobacter sp. BRD128 TaxID=2675878 RepID=UPI0015651AA3|nr:hypothetical protein [Hymenobacter sp. BRD128]QKG58675.1 hypothetical protein GKZ68_19790 [Hymenobacter sp. BRD128]
MMRKLAVLLPVVFFAWSGSAAEGGSGAASPAQPAPPLPAGRRWLGSFVSS